MLGGARDTTALLCVQQQDDTAMAIEPAAQKEAATVYFA
jgi:hypothetical protein